MLANSNKSGRENVSLYSFRIYPIGFPKMQKKTIARRRQEEGLVTLYVHRPNFERCFDVKEKNGARGWTGFISLHPISTTVCIIRGVDVADFDYYRCRCASMHGMRREYKGCNNPVATRRDGTSVVVLQSNISLSGILLFRKYS